MPAQCPTGKQHHCTVGNLYQGQLRMRGCLVRRLNNQGTVPTAAAAKTSWARSIMTTSPKRSETPNHTHHLQFRLTYSQDVAKSLYKKYARFGGKARLSNRQHWAPSKKDARLASVQPANMTPRNLLGWRAPHAIQR